MNDTAQKMNLNNGMSGTYTIDGSTSTGGTNYKTFKDALSDLVKQGVCSSVIFDVKDGAYAEQISIPKIKGANRFKTITFRGASKDSTKVNLTWPSSASTANNYTLDLSAATWVTFKHITVSRTGTSTYAYVVTMENGASNNILTNCRFLGVKTATTSTNSSVFYSNTDADTNNHFTNNIIRGGSYGMYISGTSATILEGGTVIMNNYFDSSYSTAINISYQLSPVILGNKINVNYTNGYGINFRVGNYNAIVCSKNMIYMPSGGSGIYCTSGSIYGNAIDTAFFANNFVTVGGTNTAYGIYSYVTANNTFVNFYHNSILLTNTSTASSSLYLYGFYWNYNVFNNILANKGGGYAIYLSNARTIGLEDNNDLYATGTRVGYYLGTQNTLSDWQSNTGYDVFGKSVDPKFTSNTDLHTAVSALDRAGYPFFTVPDDIDGDKRSMATPDIGADEFTSTPDDVGVTAILSPSNNMCGDSFTKLTVIIKNFGSNSQSAIPVKISINGGLPTSASTTKTLAATKTDTFTFSTTINTFAGGTYKIKAFTSLTGDLDHSNDTQSVTITVNPMATIPSSITGAALCYPGAVSLLGKSATGFTTQWYDKFSGSPAIATGDTLKTTVTGNTTFYVSSLSSKGCESKRLPVSVSVSTTGTASSLIKGATFNGKFNAGTSASPDAVCAGDTVSYGMTSPGSFTNSNYGTGWEVKNVKIATTGGSLVSSDTATVRPGTANYMVRFTPNTKSPDSIFVLTADVRLIGSGCVSKLVRYIKVNALPGAYFGFSNTCFGSMTSFTDSSRNVGLVSTRNWNFGDGNAATSFAPSNKYAATGSYIVTFKATTAAGCSDMYFRTVTIDSLPDASWITTGTIGFDVRFSPKDSTATNKTYAWDFGDASAISNVMQPTHKYAANGKYPVKLTVTSKGGCAVSDTLTVVVFNTAINGVSYSGNTLDIYPNPFNGLANISYHLQKSGTISIRIYDAQGRAILDVKESRELAGDHTYSLDANSLNLAAGIYLLQLRINDEVISKQIIRLK